jgi:3-methyladenine DNA glycosylase AlkD
MHSGQAISRLRKLGDRKYREGSGGFGINLHDKRLGVRIPELRKMAREIGKDHRLAQELWKTGYDEARMLAGFIDDPKQVTEKQMDSWVRDFNSWDVCDQVCSCLFDRSPHAWKKAVEWSSRRPEYEKRAGFVLMAGLAVHDKQAPDRDFIRFLPIIKRESADSRNFVRKAVNWALRQIGKRNPKLKKEALKAAREIQKMDDRTARWIASDAIRELERKDVK